MFTVVIPAYNCENTILRTLKSVINQTRFDLIDAIIVIDDGSIDKTGEIVKKFQDEFSVKINYVKQDNHGVSFSRNRGIRMAQSSWIALLDSDDEWLSNKIERQHEIIEQIKDIKFLGSQYPLKILFKKRQGLVKLNAKELCIRSMPPTPSVVFERETGVKLGLFDEKMQYSEDMEFFQKFLLLDSYYVLAEKLINIDTGKKFHGQSGLSSCYIAMHKGRNANVEKMYNMGLISKTYMFFILAFNELKLIRRVLIRALNRGFEFILK